jgi:hypothetical protein
MAGARADVIALSDYVHERTRSRLGGLTDGLTWHPALHDDRVAAAAPR